MTTRENRLKIRWQALLAVGLLLVLGMGAGIVSQQADRNGPARVALDPDGAEGYAVQFGKGQTESNQLTSIEDYWLTRVTYPTGKFNGAWLQAADVKKSCSTASSVAIGRSSRRKRARGSSRRSAALCG